MNRSASEGIGTESEARGGGQYIIAVGASAGGLEAIEELFRSIEPDTGAAFVIVQHLSPDFKSLMGQLLARHTQLPIQQAADDMPVQPDHIYLIPPRVEMRIAKGRLQLSAQRKDRTPPLPIDVFFQSLAEDAGDKAIGIILSGTGTDGSRGVQAIKQAGGMVMVQDEASAKFDGMPIAAIATGAADVVLPPSAMGAKLEAYLVAPQLPFDEPLLASSDPLKDILQLVKRERGIDLTQYKERMIQRRTVRRMGIVHVGNLEEYRNLLIQAPTEVDYLLRDLLIGVTQCFRDEDAFAVLAQQIPRLVMLARDEPVRVWVAGCSTGEEVYSIAMLFEEYMANSEQALEYKIFGTDINPKAVAHASEGLYAHSLQDALSPRRLSAYFERTPDGYRVRRVLRDRVVFAEHDLSKDPPFTRMQLVTCRNLLVYVTPEAQSRILQFLHFALVRDGVLFLGPSESLGLCADEFDEIDSKWRIFRKRRDVRLSIAPEISGSKNKGRIVRVPRPVPHHSSLDAERICTALLSEYAPACVILDQDGIVIHVFGDVSRFLSMPPGRATLDFLRMLDPGARTAVSTAMHRARNSAEDVHYEGVAFGVGGKSVEADLAVKWVTEEEDRPGSGLFLVLLGDPHAVKEDSAKQVTQRGQETLRIQQLEEELQHTKEALQSTIEELETTNEELQSTNEELLASNEELQSTNEELHSVNEELYTVNAEYHKKIEELTVLSGDVENLLRSTGVGTLFLDEELNIRKFTPQAVDVLPIMASDIGRPIQHLANSLRGVNLMEDAQKVLNTGQMVERETVDQRKVPRIVRMLPYQVHGRHQGVVLTFIDITKVKAAQLSLAESEDRFQRMVEHLDQVFWMLTPDAQQFTYVSPLFETVWGISAQALYEEASAWLEPIHAEDREEAKKLLDPKQIERGIDLECRLHSPDGEEQWFHFRANPVTNEQGEVVGFAGSARDVTTRKQRQAELTELARELESQAQRDALTGLANRRGLESLLTRELARARRSGAKLAAVLIDADDFKKVNDSLGHATGDMVLQGMANRMLDTLRPSDVLSRVGGDEFLAVLPETRLAEAVQVAERLRLAIADHPMMFGDQPLQATASLGVAMVTSSIVSIEEILNSTRHALAESKLNGKNRVVAATDGEGNRHSITPGTDRITDFAESGVIKAYAQEIHSTVGGETVAYEMLSRGPEGPYHNPGEFFRLSHEKNALTLVDLRCLRTCIEASAQLEAGRPIHINIFPSTLVDTPIERIVQLMEKAGGADRFCVELSEQQFIGAPSYLAEGVAKLKEAGVRVAIDDVGFGRSSLEALVMLEPDVIKIAREFVQDVDTHVPRRRGLSRLAKATRTLSSSLVAEGVETEGERDVLIDLGISLAQGFLWDRPAPVGV